MVWHNLWMSVHRMIKVLWRIQWNIWNIKALINSCDVDRAIRKHLRWRLIDDLSCSLWTYVHVTVRQNSYTSLSQRTILAWHNFPVISANPVFIHDASSLSLYEVLHYLSISFVIVGSACLVSLRNVCVTWGRNKNTWIARHWLRHKNVRSVFVCLILCLFNFIFKFAYHCRLCILIFFKPFQLLR